jgi:hypothetical protein
MTDKQLMELVDAVPCRSRGVQVYVDSSIHTDGPSYYIRTSPGTPIQRLRMPDDCFDWALFVMPHGTTVIAYKKDDSVIWQWSAPACWKEVTRLHVAINACVAVDGRKLMVTTRCPIRHWAVDVHKGTVIRDGFPALTRLVTVSTLRWPGYQYVADGVIAMRHHGYGFKNSATAVVDVYTGEVLARDPCRWYGYSDNMQVVPYMYVRCVCELDNEYDGTEVIRWSVTVPRVDLYCSVRWMWIAAILLTT